MWSDTSNTVGDWATHPSWGSEGQHYSFYLLPYISEVYKVIWQTFLEISCHLESLQPRFCSALPKEGKEVYKSRPVNSAEWREYRERTWLAACCVWHKLWELIGCDPAQSSATAEVKIAYRHFGNKRQSWEKIWWGIPWRTGFAAPPAATKNSYWSCKSLTSPGRSYNPRYPSLSPAAVSAARVWPNPNRQVPISHSHLTTCYHAHRGCCFQPSICFICQGACSLELLYLHSPLPCSELLLEHVAAGATLCVKMLQSIETHPHAGHLNRDFYLVLQLFVFCCLGVF